MLKIKLKLFSRPQVPLNLALVSLSSVTPNHFSSSTLCLSPLEGDSRGREQFDGKGPEEQSTRAKAEAEPQVQCVDPAESTENWPKQGFQTFGFKQLQAVGYEYQGPTLGKHLGISHLAAWT